MKIAGMMLVALIAGVTFWLVNKSAAPKAPARVQFLAPVPLTQYAHVQDGAIGAKIAGSLFDGVGQLFNFATERNGGYEAPIGNLADGNPFSIGL